MPQSRRHFRLMLMLSPLAALLWLGISQLWQARLPAMGPITYLGLLQGDQPTYTALARAVFTRGNGLFYANPFDYDLTAPRVLTNLGYVLLGWLLRLCADHAVPAWEVWRVAWGTLAYVLWGVLVRRLIAGRGMRWWAWLAGAFGGGLAWVGMLSLMTRQHLPALEAFAQVEEHYGWWCLNLFRQNLYPFELTYHAFFLAALLLFLARRRAALVGLACALWWLHPITALLTTSLLGVALLGDCLREEERAARPRNLAALLGLAAVVAVAVFYYRVYLPGFPSVASWINQTLGFVPHLAARDYLPAYGLLLIALPLCSLLPRLRAWLHHDRSGRLVALWGVFVLVWSNNDLFLPQPIQPLHFMRGHWYLFLVLVLARAVDLYRRELRAHLAWNTRRARQVAWASLLLLVPDNAMFVVRLATELPQPALLTVSRSAHEVLNYFAAHPAASPRVLFSMDQKLGTLLVMRGERVYASEAVLTPYFGERLARLGAALQQGDLAVPRQLGVDTFIFMPALRPLPPWAQDRAQLQQLFINNDYIIVRLK